MPVHFEMRSDDRLAYWELTDPWTIEELLAFMPAAKEHLNAAVPPVFSFVDLRNARKIPQGLFQLSKLAIWDMPNGRDVVFVSHSAAVRATIQLLFRLSGSDRQVMFAEYDQAWAYMEGLLASTAKTGKFRLDNFK
jgi:hypothetical protein